MPSLKQFNKSKVNCLKPEFRKKVPVFVLMSATWKNLFHFSLSSGQTVMSLNQLRHSKQCQSNACRSDIFIIRLFLPSKNRTPTGLVSFLQFINLTVKIRGNRGMSTLFSSTYNTATFRRNESGCLYYVAIKTGFLHRTDSTPLTLSG